MRRTGAQISFLSLSSLVLTFLVTGCVATPPPYEEYTLARSAVRAAREHDSARFATGYWQRAEEHFRHGERAYKDNDFGPAKEHFLKAKLFSERAENATRLKKFQSGEAFP